MKAAAGVLFLCSKSNRVLLAQRSDHCDQSGTWASFGGGVDKGETADQAARREVSEEAGYHADYSLIPLYRYNAPGFTYTNYLSVIDHEFYPMTNYETAQSGWFALDELPEDLHPGFKMCLENNRAQKVIRNNLSQDLNESLPAPEPHVHSAVDPALLTFKEYYDIVGDDKRHPDSAYSVSVADLNKTPSMWESFDEKIRRMKVRGLWFEIRLRRDKNHYAKRGPNGYDVLRDAAGNVEYFSDDEIRALGKPLEERSLAIFNEENQAVASFSDEWGCALIRVASEYQGFGFGPLLTKMGMTLYPEKPSGGFTPGGLRTFRRTHLLFVNEALRTGRYVDLVRRGEMSASRAKAIVASAKDNIGNRAYDEYRRNDDVDLGSNDPKTWMLYGDEYGCFVLYDRKLKDIYEDGERFDHFTEKMIKGLIYVSGEKVGILYAYGGESKEIRGFLLRCAAAYCEKENLPFAVDEEDVGDIPEKFIERVGGMHTTTGFRRQTIHIRAGQEFDYTDMVRLEEQWRRTFDRYDEFKTRMLEMAYAKYRPS